MGSTIMSNKSIGNNHLLKERVGTFAHSTNFCVCRHHSVPPLVS